MHDVGKHTGGVSEAPQAVSTSVIASNSGVEPTPWECVPSSSESGATGFQVALMALIDLLSHSLAVGPKKLNEAGFLLLQVDECCRALCPCLLFDVGTAV